MKDFNQAYFKALEQLNEKQRAAVETIEGPVLVIAGPGTGKTQILAARIGNILQKTDSGPENILCLTFTDAGTVAMRKRLLDFIGPEAYKIDVHTFHSFTNQVIKDNPALFGHTELNTLNELEEIDLYNEIINGFDSQHPLRKWGRGKYFEMPRLKDLFSKMKRENWSPKKIIDSIDIYIKRESDNPAWKYKRDYKAKDGTVRPKDSYKPDYETKVLKPMRQLKAAVEEFETYNTLLQKKGRYDYNDMIKWVLDKFADPEHEDLLRSYQERYHYFLVDEYQDTNGAQNALLYQLIDFFENPNVFVVGDDDQSIYRFQGASVSNIGDFKKKYKDYLSIITLEKNYRSTQSILNISKRLIEENKDRLINDTPGLTKNLTAGREERINSQAKPEVRIYPNAMHQTVHIAKEIERLKNEGTALKEIAVIYAKHKSAEDICKYFALKEIPFQTKKKKDILQSVLINQLLDMLRLIADESNEPHSRNDLIFETLHFPWFEIDALTIANLAYDLRTNYKARWRVELQKKSAKLQMDMFADQNNYQAEQMANLNRAGDFYEYWIKEIRNVTVPILVEKVITQSGMLGYVMNHPDKRNLMKELTTFFDFVKDAAERKPRLKLTSLINDILKMQDNELPLSIQQISGDPNGVWFMSAHGSKGLEFKHVFILDTVPNQWEKSRGPNTSYKLPSNLIASNSSDNIIEERRRLFYVAATRAEEHLYMCYPQRNANDKEQVASTFVEEMKIAKDDIVEKNIMLEEDDILEFKMNILEEAPTPDIQTIDDQMIEAVLQKYVLSVTHLTSYLKCPKNFYFNTILRAPAAMNEALTYGNVMHKTLENYFKAMKDHPDNKFGDLEDLQKLFKLQMKAHKAKFTEEQYEEKEKQGYHHLELYYNKYIEEWKQHKIITLEYQARNVVFEDIPLKGAIDKMEFDGNDVNVVDYKSGKFNKNKFSPPLPEEKWKNSDAPETWEELGGDLWRQGVFYKILIDADPRNNWKVKSTEFDFIEADTQKKLTKKSVIITKEDEDLLKDQIKSAWQGIQNKEFSGECKDPYCRWCSFVKNNYRDSVELSEDTVNEELIEQEISESPLN